MTDPAVIIDEEFFTDLLPRIHDLAELKIVLYASRHAQNGRPATLAALLTPEIIRSVVGLDSPEPAEERMMRAIDRAVANESLLRLTIAGRHAYLPATNHNRARIDAALQGVADPSLGLPPDRDVAVYRPNVFAFYERHIGPLTPLLAERLRDAERTYPRSWIEQAILEAVNYSRRNWRYIEAILARWDEVGGPNETHDRRA